MPAQPALKKVLSFWDVLVIAMGQIIGAGVVALTGIAIGMTGPAVIFAYPVSAVLVLVVTILIMMAGTVLPATGAYYAWASRLGNGWLGSMLLSLSLLASVSISLYGSSFGLYLNPIFPALSVNAWGIVIIIVLFGANLFGLKIASKVQMGLVLMLISALAVYAGFAMPNVDTSRLTPMLPNGIVGFITAVFLLKFATSGAYMIVGISGEMHNPKKVIPVVMTIATVTVAVIYSFVALSAVGTVPWQDMIDQPLTVAGKTFLPSWAFTYFLIAGAGLAICTTLNSQFIQLPRSYIVASWDGLIPEWIGTLNRFGAPYFVLIIMLIVGITPLVADLDIGTIARAATISATFPAFIVYWVVTRIPDRYPEAYARSIFKMNRFWLWTLFLISELSSVVGVYFLAQDLPSTVIITILVWVSLSVCYYPLRRSYLRKKGIDLDANTQNPSIFETG
ncbi:MAG: APA family basic amino acid/polyamine antiporter [Candidatus Azotimanducaceae bacterium]